MPDLSPGDTVFVPHRPYPGYAGECERHEIHGLVESIDEAREVALIREFKTWAFRSVPLADCRRQAPYSSKPSIEHRMQLARSKAHGDEVLLAKLKLRYEKLLIQLADQKPAFWEKAA